MPDRVKRREVKGSHSRGKRLTVMEIPITLERVLIRAASDASFRRSFLDDPERAVCDGGYRMVASEKASLMAIPRSTLEIMIDRFQPQKHTRNRFARKVVTAVAGTLIVTAASCGPNDASQDATEEEAIQDATEEDARPDFGIDDVGGDSPDWPPDIIEEDPGPDVIEDVLDDGDASDMMDVEDDVDEDSADDMEESDG